MKNFNVIRGTFYVLSNIILGTLELVLKGIYMLLPIGLYIALLQFRDKVSKASAIHTFTKDVSTFQFIHKNFILVCIDPSTVRIRNKNILKSIDKFFEKYKSVITLGTIFLLLLFVYIGMVVK